MYYFHFDKYPWHFFKGWVYREEYLHLLIDEWYLPMQCIALCIYNCCFLYQTLMWCYYQTSRN